MSLVDTPGFGEFDSRVEALATEALKSSSVCVYVTAYNDLRAQASGDYLKFMLQHDPGTLICSWLCVNYSFIMSLFDGTTVLNLTIDLEIFNVKLFLGF